MLRITFTILAIVASAVTLMTNSVEMNEWWKYIPMAGLILISLILWISVPSSRRRPKPKTSDSELQDLNKEESLADLGILDIRPVSSDNPPVDTKESLPAQRTPSATADPSEPVQLSLIAETSPPDTGDTHIFPESSDPLDKHTLIPVLQGFRAALDAHAVGIIHAVSKDSKYEVCGTAGFDWIRSRGESFVLKYDLLSESETTAIHPVGSKGLQSNHLTYSRKPASITSIGVTRIGLTGKLLLVDTIHKNGLFHPRAKELLENFGQTLSLLFYREDPNRPRYEIIYEEMMTARSEKKDLALALVIPQRSEPLTRMYADLLDDIEKTFSECLIRADPDSRVVKFGELLFGVFKDCSQDGLEVWQQTVQNEIAQQGGLLTGGAFIGAVVMADKHQTADHLRDDAKRALVKAYQGPADMVIA